MSANTITDSFTQLVDTASITQLPVGTTSTTVAAGNDSRIVGAAQKASNLSDLASPSTALSNLGGATAAALATTNATASALATTVAGKLTASSNLSDVASASAARTNLGLGSISTASASAYVATATNLTDLASASSARTNLGLGGAAVLNVGTSSSTVAAGNDSRITSSNKFAVARGLSILSTRPNDLGSGRGQDTTGNGRTYSARYYLPYAASNLVIRFDNYYSNTFYSDPNTNDIIVKAVVSFDSSGTIRAPVLFNGLRAGLIPGNQAIGSFIEGQCSIYVPPNTPIYIRVYVQPVSYSRVATISGSPTGGTFTLTFGGQTTSSIAFNAAASAVQTALNALSTAGSASITVSGSAGGPYTIALPTPNPLTIIPALTATSSLTGGTSPAVTMTTSSAVYFPLGQYILGTTNSTGEGVNTSLDTTDSGSVSATDGTCYGPTAILGNSTSAPFVTVGLLGDSIMRATGDTFSFLGFGVRGLGTTQNVGSPATIDGSIPYILLAKGGEVTTDQLAGSGSTPLRGMVRLARAQYATHVICDTATNDIGAGTSLATIQANILTIASQYASLKCKFYQTTITPRTSSTDSWRTTANQSIPNSGQETIRTSLNDWLRGGSPIDPTSKAAVAVGTGGALLAGSAGHPVNGYIETADTVETSRNSGVWKAPPNIYDSGTASSATSTTLVDSSKTWTVNAHSGRRLAIKTGAGSGQARGISSNTATTITLAGAGNTWAVTPDATSTYQIDDGYSIGDSGGIGVHPAPNGHVAMAVPVATAAASFSV